MKLTEIVLRKVTKPIIKYQEFKLKTPFVCVFFLFLINGVMEINN